MSNPRIFISYRRDESTGYAGRIHERLAHLYGTDAVFMDMDDIGPGADFVSVLDTQISTCDTLLVLIGKGWLTQQDSNGGRRIDDPNDFVRIEISKGLARNIRIIPLLLNNASMPPEQKLPDDLKALSRYQAIELSEERWEYDFSKLVKTLGGGSDKRSRRRSVVAAISVIVLVALLAVLWQSRETTTVVGRWTAEVQYEFDPPRSEVFVFEQMGANIRGTASFLEVNRAIVEGKLDSDMLSFITRTLEVQGGENRESTHLYNGKVSDQEIQFVMQTVGGFSVHPAISFTARRVADVR